MASNSSATPGRLIDGGANICITGDLDSLFEVVAIPPLSMLEESAWANPDARIRPLTHVSVDRAYQAESVRDNSLSSILISIRHLQIYE